MPVWRDPLDELIVALERVAPVGTATEQAFELPPPMEDYAIAVQAVLSRDPVERARLAENPAVERIDEYHARLARMRQSSGAVRPEV
jgi:hypothetical protein